MASKKGKHEENRHPAPPDSPEDMASIIERTRAAEMASTWETVADLLK